DRAAAAVAGAGGAAFAAGKRQSEWASLRIPGKRLAGFSKFLAEPWKRFVYRLADPAADLQGLKTG
ncbi:MAG: hypothetical protein IJE71_03510, partial [Clostridia bacterium]|nr:hypothetical protein [Clostridia bacterium]